MKLVVDPSGGLQRTAYLPQSSHAAHCTTCSPEEAGTFRHLLTISYNCRWSMQGQLGQFDFYGGTFRRSYEESIFSAPNTTPMSVLMGGFHRKQDS